MYPAADAWRAQKAPEEIQWQAGLLVQPQGAVTTGKSMKLACSPEVYTRCVALR